MARLLMGRFDIYSNPGRNRGNIPYLVDVQSNVISGLATRIVIPLRTLAGFSSLALPGDLFPIIDVDGVPHFLDTPQMGAIPLSELKVKAGSAQTHQFDIQTALDRVFGAY
jgi:toxin CcdB